MTFRTTLAALAYAALITGCSAGNTDAQPATDDASSAAPAASPAEETEIMPGLTMTKLKNGHGRAAVAGDYASVHYTGWLFDESAEDGRGEKFDSSVDRGEEFQFPLGAGRVIKGWDEGVVGMLIGEKRELKIAPELGYGERGAGAVIPPGATLIFEVELMGLLAPKDAG
ncbi:MAG: FKBP-type peptidyl-prolyl cis-trans isomerase [Woeseiaceae bacterium]